MVDSPRAESGCSEKLKRCPQDHHGMSCQGIGMAPAGKFSDRSAPWMVLMVR